MWEGSYGKEPFDLRLTALRLIRNLDKILALTVVGTLLFGGGYYVKNVLFGPEPMYAATSTYKVEYVSYPDETGDYYVNEATWNTYVHTKEFIDAVQKHLQEIIVADGGMELVMDNEELSGTLSATLASDLCVPATTVTTDDGRKTTLIAAAVEQAIMKEFVAGAKQEITAIRVIDPAITAREVKPDVRPVRAFVLSAILSFFFVVVLFLLREMGADSIWLPATLRRRYGVPCVGTVSSSQLNENVTYLFREKKKIAVCSLDGEVNTAEVAEVLERQGVNRKELSGKEWIPVPTPLLCPESCEMLRKMDGILLVVKAGSHAGKPLEYVLEFLAGQDCEVTAALLWEADELLLRTYYCLQPMEKV